MTPPKEYLDRAIRYLREVRSELRKVTWPQRKEVIRSTVVVIAATFVVSFFLGAVDLVLSRLLVLIIR